MNRPVLRFFSCTFPMHLVLAALAVLLVCLARPASAAGPGAAATPAEGRVSFFLFGDVVGGRPGDDFERDLRGATLHDPYSPSGNGEYLGGGATPQSRGGRTGYGIGLGYSLTPRWELRGLVRGEERLEALGVRQVLYRVQLSLDESSTRYAAVLYHRPAELPARLGIGVALVSAEVRARDDWTEFPANVDSRLGFVVDGGFTWPRATRVFAEVGAQYWYGGDMSYGPYDVRNGIGNIQVYYPRRSYSLDRVTAGVGLGIRI